MSERNKWGNIPVTMVEIDQDFCAQRWGEGKCQAGPENNYQIYNRLFDDDLDNFWSTNGISENDALGVVEAPQNQIYERVNVLRLSVAINGSGFLTVPVAQRPFLPVFTTRPTLTVSGYFYNFSGTWDFKLAISTDGGQSIIKRGVRIDFSDNSGTLDSDVSNYNVDTSLSFWDRFTFDVDMSGIVSEGTSFSCFVDLADVNADFNAQFFTQPQISIGGVQRFRAVDDQAKLSDPQPCFNTLSTCQNPKNYTVKGQTDALLATVIA